MSLTLVVVAVAGAGLGGCSTGPTGRDVRTASDETDLDRRARVRLELAAAYFQRGQHTTALDEVKQALVAKPTYLDALNLRALIYGAMKEPVLAEESFRRALSVDADHADTLHNYGWFLCQQRRYGEAERQFLRANAQPSYREQGKTFLALGVCQARDRRLPEAEQSLMRAFELDPGSPTVAVNLSEVLYRRGEFERARFYVRRVNVSEDMVSAQSLWLAIRIERKLDQPAVMRVLGRQLSERFQGSPEVQLYEKGLFDE
ncbi:type IV pilus biogenesis/stability protein PilW [Ideonella livida]|nr:type IV pilus biogenesis/stability protein PilW [Ideonella livida]